ncbi:MAG: hypothetical protein OEY81_02585 [Candidatus Bathyarchaeota archaeon]|nr:hypothetical protein [Candidatus Bathyarchaeota archaeon]
MVKQTSAVTMLTKSNTASLLTAGPDYVNVKYLGIKQDSTE